MRKVTGFLDKVAKQLQSTELKVGFMAGATYPDGTSVPMVAAVQEYGGTIKVPERTQDIHFKMNKKGEVGHRFVKKKVANFVQTVTVPAHTVQIPSRPFFRNAIAQNKAKWQQTLVKGLLAGKSVTQVLDVLGAQIQGDVVESIATIDTPVISNKTWNKRRTRKIMPNNSDKPLVDTKVMINSVTYRVDEK
ncbi:TPA: hypothetical protein KEY88_005289 [Serratia marcescens]|uniref:Neck protein n=2 Tax=Serratia TaxID=613 RepID=A0A9X8VJ48_SERMA|nr:MULTISPECIES: hypothetical protein [Serratia]MBS3894699.1 hypothetical protein [Serratia marcescens]TXE25884.1 hypothetical protein FOT63_22000 [Serratia ureilytica]HBC7422516.1 hypothetical protein [Serratia marcescens]